MSKTLGQRRNDSGCTGLEPEECLAMRLCSAAGWSAGELAMTFELSKPSVYPHLNDTCSHDHKTTDVEAIQ